MGQGGLLVWVTYGLGWGLRQPPSLSRVGLMVGTVLPGHGVPLSRATVALVEVMTDKRL